jgi:2-phospho-L-lactate/phosphoenolpyruvate guanylyltransferase
VQATVHRFEPETGSGSVLTDTGEVHPFGPQALAGSGLRHLRLGQRLTVQQADDGTVTALRLGP